MVVHYQHKHEHTGRHTNHWVEGANGARRVLLSSPRPRVCSLSFPPLRTRARWLHLCEPVSGSGVNSSHAKKLSMQHARLPPPQKRLQSTSDSSTSFGSFLVAFLFPVHSSAHSHVPCLSLWCYRGVIFDIQSHRHQQASIMPPSTRAVSSFNPDVVEVVVFSSLSSRTPV